MSKIAIFASGNGTNAQAIIKYFQQNNPKIQVVAVLSNNENAPVLQKAKMLKVKTLAFNPKEFKTNQNKVLEFLSQNQVEIIVLAGYMLLIPQTIVQKYKGKILNIHPALLPKFGGKGMYGENVHKAVINAQEKESGITIHHVSEKYDQGDIIFQKTTQIEQNDTPESLAQKIHKLEHEYYPLVIEQIINAL